MPDVLVQDRLVASVGLDGDMAAAKQHGKSVVVFADAGRIVVMVWESYQGGDAFVMLSHPSVAALRAGDPENDVPPGPEDVEPDCCWQGVEYVESDMQADCWTQSEDRASLAREYRVWGAA